MDIEDIERQKYNLRLFFRFLKNKNVYLKIRNRIFSNNRTIYDLFKSISKDENIHIVLHDFERDNLSNSIDLKYSAILTYVPFFGGYWTPNEICFMAKLSEEWKKFLVENNMDKMNNR